MNRTKIENYAPNARQEFIQAVTGRASFFGMKEVDGTLLIKPLIEKGDIVLMGGEAFPRAVGEKRKRLEERIRQHGFHQTMETLAYTWFNRIVAIRFMERNGYLDHGYRVLSHPEGKLTPEILEHAEHVDLPGLDRQKVIDLKIDGTKEAELYRLLLIAQCNALHSAMPFLFGRIDDETELVLPDNLLHSDSLIRKLVNEIDEEDWLEVEIIGWLYEAYISERYEAVIGKVVASEDIPAATQRFTPKWIVRYLVQNTLGRMWLATYPQSALRQQMKYLIEPAEQTPEVQDQLNAITPASLNPEETTFLDPACGSGHILVEAYDVFKAIYQERGYRAKDIPSLILGKNLFGLEIDDRAAQLAAFALMMKARADDRRIFDSGVTLNVVAIQNGLPLPELKQAIPEDSPAYPDYAYLHATYQNAKTYGSLIQPAYKPGVLHDDFATELTQTALEDLFSGGIATLTLNLLHQHRLLTRQYDAVVTNPPYMGTRFYNHDLKQYVDAHYLAGKSDLYAAFILRNTAFTSHNGCFGMITIPNWMFLPSFEDMRKSILCNQYLPSFLHNGRGVFGSDFGSCAFVVVNYLLDAYRGHYKRLFDVQGSVVSNAELESRFFGTTPFITQQKLFQRIPGSPIAYWASEAIVKAFERGTPLSEVAQPRQGMATSDNDRFIRFWHEVDFGRMALHCRSRSESKECGKKWFPYNKGGEFRKWCGNYGAVINWLNDGEEVLGYAGDLYGSPTRTIKNLDWYFRKGITWSRISSSLFGVRYLDDGFLFDANGSVVFPAEDDLFLLLAFLCSEVTFRLLAILNPSLSFQTGDVAKLPILRDALQARKAEVVAAASKAVELSRNDWDGHETSWAFTQSAILGDATVSRAISRYTERRRENIEVVRAIEERVNRIVIEAYGLNGELSPRVREEQVTLYRPDRLEDTKRLLSYAIGCMMGRYSLDKPGLIYARSRNVGFAPSSPLN